MGFIAKIGSPGVSPHQSRFKLTHYLNQVGIRRWMIGKRNGAWAGKAEILKAETLKLESDRQNEETGLEKV